MNHIQQISYERQGIGDIGYTDDTTKINAVYGTISAPKHGTSTNTGYFLASRSYVYSSNTCKYNITNVTANGTIDRQQPYLITGNNTSITNASISSTVRPVITMYSYVIPFTGDAFGDYLLNFLLKYVCVFGVSLLFAKCVRFVLKKLGG